MSAISISRPIRDREEHDEVCDECCYRDENARRLPHLVRGFRGEAWRLAHDGEAIHVPKHREPANGYFTWCIGTSFHIVQGKSVTIGRLGWHDDRLPSWVVDELRLGIDLPGADHGDGLGVDGDDCGARWRKEFGIIGAEIKIVAPGAVVRERRDGPRCGRWTTILDSDRRRSVGRIEDAVHRAVAVCGELRCDDGRIDELVARLCAVS